MPLLSCMLILFGWIDGGSTIGTLLSLPIWFNDMALAIWLLLQGVNLSLAPKPSQKADNSVWQAAEIVDGRALCSSDCADEFADWSFRQPVVVLQVATFSVMQPATGDVGPGYWQPSSVWRAIAPASQAPTAIWPSFERRPLTSYKKNWLHSIIHKRGLSTKDGLDELGLAPRNISVWTSVHQGTRISPDILERLNHWSQ